MNDLSAPREFRKVLSIVSKPTPSVLAEVERSVSANREQKSTNALFMVMREGGGMPTRLHGSRGEAKMEAMRLALRHPKEKFHVLKTWKVFGVSDG